LSGIEVLGLDGNLGVVLKLLSKIEHGLNGSIDGKACEAVSAKASNPAKRLFIFKGWVKDKVGPAVRFRVKLGHLGDADVLYAPENQTWEETELQHADLDLHGTKIVLKFSFKTEDGTTHQAEFLS